MAHIQLWLAALFLGITILILIFFSIGVRNSKGNVSSVEYVLISLIACIPFLIAIQILILHIVV